MSGECDRVRSITAPLLDGGARKVLGDRLEEEETKRRWRRGRRKRREEKEEELSQRSGGRERVKVLNDGSSSPWYLRGETGHETEEEG